MAVEKYSIGGTVLETEAFEAFADIPQNRVLLAEKFTADTPIKPEIVGGLTTIEQVFEHFKPQVEVEFETEEGTMRKETMRFKNLGDFGIKGITPQSRLLNELTLKREQYQKIIRQLKTNKLLKQALADKAYKENLIASLNALVQELEAAR
ncbi:hypothetical protein ACFS7Z_08155 [Pontibacter toksunensis]|uniref:Type VI secretion system (T6SS) VipA/Hcp2 family protein n=1 Tax=Pontibacter toksunensis TaxID=1332631 RepID=A0ABW6BR72_9BACT